ncbi:MULTISPECIES: rhodanese-like domain-containing protein [Paeniglutamicibacter]|uniref:Rhodanese-like domain-containing protein n=3 Tax=Paeniglutamicibacter TaxID=1742990 RepID=M7MP41_9MICC|nr:MULTISPECIES: rhodanese-like domain-containing protein [Paeniglutamicibacter]EMQ96776.1 rhodanese-like domain-containing protein [Paeniglutamicibacter gangotriensis Lz1y]KAA0976529.1 rhodanese-like domain-containing protein [Paeniglutamicibacter gangotriensis]MDO2934100.1 rhodanese-like domain-containing protein [Paeniglutamicibacter sulfureus]NKG21811.1 rhodanese-like domain-containing protein [Paeniglutamicibacter terrestris]
MNTTPQSTIPQSTSPEELKNWIANGTDVVVLDVRSAAEFETLHIKGSYNVPLPLLAEHTEELAAKLDTKVVLVCQSGVRATEAKTNLASVGFGNAHVLSGGVPAYQQAGGQTVEGSKRWALERQVRMVAGSLVVAGLAGGKFLSPQLRTVAGAIGAGLTFSAATNTCAMGKALAVMPWNKTGNEPTRESVMAQLPAKKS